MACPCQNRRREQQTSAQLPSTPQPQPPQPLPGETQTPRHLVANPNG